MIGLRLMWRDVWEIVQGTITFCKYLVSQDHIAVGLGLFSAESSMVRKGASNKYCVRIVCTDRETQKVKLLMDIYAVNAQANTDGHHSYFVKEVKIPPRAVLNIEIRYDWSHSVEFGYQGGSHVPDVFWKGAYTTPQLYSIIAVLLDEQGHELDRLIILQELVA